MGVRFDRVTYYTVDGNDMVFTPTYADGIGETLSDVVDWCTEQFGPGGENGWQYVAGMFVFTDEAAATAFRVRWC